MIYYSSNEEVTLRQIRELIKKIECVNIKPEYVVFRLLRSDFKEWSELLSMREDLLLEST